jgi:RNA polymerase sigma-B factor
MASAPTRRSPVNHAYGQRNTRLLARYASDRSLANRNAVVQANLPLVHYESGRGASLSSAAMPWIVGAIRQHLRDRGQCLRGGRTLRELHQRGQLLQARRQQQHLPPLAAAELAAALGCSPERWQEALGLQQALSMASL